MNLLQQRIMKASQAYYSDGTSNVSDAEFDAMLDQLAKEDPNSPLLETGHGYDVYLDTTPGEKVTHRYGMIGSLRKCHNYQELNSSLKSEEFLWATLKLDGLSVVLYYVNGLLVQALTRGRDDIGIDVTSKVKRILNADKINDTSFTGAVRGEILMSHDNFFRFQAIHPEAENARNSAAGLMNANEISEELSFLDIVVYTVVGLDVLNSQFLSYTDMRNWLSIQFDHIVNGCVLHDQEFSESSFESSMYSLQSSWYGDYPADGIVLCRDTLVASPGKLDGHVIMYTSDAFKFPAERVDSEVIDVEWSLSKTRYMIPVVKIVPVRLAGTTVQAATGISADYIRQNKLGLGAKVILEKANEIIPKIVEITTPGDVKLPSICPACGHELNWSGVHLQCQNVDCAGGDLQDVLVWMETISPCERLGDKLKTTFLTELFGSDISIEKIYNSNLKDVFLCDTSVQKQLFANMYKQLFTRKVKLSDAIKALNIPRFGDVNSRKLAEYPDLVKKLLDAAIDNSVETTNISDKIGEANFNSLISNLRKLKRLMFIKDNIIWEPEVSEKGKVAITGKLSVSRSVFETELKNAGYTPSSSIGKDTKYLITNDPMSDSSKNKQADQFGIPKITEHEFRFKYLTIT